MEKSDDGSLSWILRLVEGWRPGQVEGLVLGQMEG
jgi:hypothetical protein